MNKLKIENHMKSRSLSAITATAYRLLSQNMKLWMRRLWPWVIGFAMASGIIYSACTMIMSEKNPTTTLVLWGIAFVAVLAEIFLYACASGSIMAALKEQKTKPNIKRALRLALLFALIYIVFLIVYYAISISLVLIWNIGVLYIHILIAFGLMLLGMIIMLPVCYSGMRYLAEDDLKLGSVFGKNYLIGLRHFWRLFLTVFVVMLISMLLASLLAAPLGVIVMASMQDALGIYLGDPSGMPATQPLLIFLAAFIATIACTFIWLWQFFCIYYQYGSITTRIKEYEKAIND